MKELICICCPNGCHLQVDTEREYTVSGNRCARGAEYGRTELLHPVRVVTSTVRITGAAQPRLPVKTDRPVDKPRMFDVMRLLDDLTVEAPVRTGDILLRDILGTDASIVVCKDMENQLTPAGANSKKSGGLF